MAPHLDFIGQRADKSVVVDIGNSDEIPEEEGFFVKYGVVKTIEEYTISCDECGADGYYDERGEIVCEGCGMVLSGDRQPVLDIDYPDDPEKARSPGSSRGMGSEVGRTVRGTHEPSQGYTDYYES